MDIQSQCRQEIRDMIKEGLEIKIPYLSWDVGHIKIQIIWEEEILSEAIIDSCDIKGLL